MTIYIYLLHLPANHTFRSRTGMTVSCPVRNLFQGDRRSGSCSQTLEQCEVVGNKCCQAQQEAFYLDSPVLWWIRRHLFRWKKLTFGPFRLSTLPTTLVVPRGVALVPCSEWMWQGHPYWSKFGNPGTRCWNLFGLLRSEHLQPLQLTSAPPDLMRLPSDEM